MSKTNTRGQPLNLEEFASPNFPLFVDSPHHTSDASDRILSTAERKTRRARN
jgi:hypothetical protein